MTKLRVRCHFDEHGLFRQQILNAQRGSAGVDRVDGAGNVAKRSRDNFVGLQFSSIGLALAALHIVLWSLKARNEERHLIATHGDAYAKYLGRTGRFIPRSGART